jgi:hypothetical protein
LGISRMQWDAAACILDFGAPSRHRNRGDRSTRSPMHANALGCSPGAFRFRVFIRRIDLRVRRRTPRPSASLHRSIRLALKHPTRIPMPSRGQGLAASAFSCLVVLRRGRRTRTPAHGCAGRTTRSPQRIATDDIGATDYRSHGRAGFSPLLFSRNAAAWFSTVE